MRFPKLTTLFHRRTRSDPEIHRLASPPYAFPEADTRAASTDCIFDLALPPSSSSDIDAFAAYACASAPSIDSHLSSLPTFTLAYCHGEHLEHSFLPPGTSTLPSSSTTTTLGTYPPSEYEYEYPPEANADASHLSPPDAVEHYPHGVLAVLTERIQDLETALLEECEANACIPELQDALGAERRARTAAEEANAGLTRTVGVLRDEVLQLRRVLFSAIASGGGPPDSGALAVERDRLRHFFDLMVSVGAHRPVIDAGYRGVVQGEDAETAVVRAIQGALEQPESVWRQLLEPVTGPRTPAEYMAQVRCTLRARREVRELKWKAGFWKGKAREDGRCEETVTPSASKIEEVVEEEEDAVPEERAARVEEMMVQLRRGELPLRVQHMGNTVSTLARTSAPAAADFVGQPSAYGTQAEIDTLAELVDVLPPSWLLDDFKGLPATSSSMVLPTADSDSTARISSIAARQNSSSNSKSDVPLSASGSRMTASDSTSTTPSVKSRRRHAKVLTVPCVSATTTAAAPSDMSLSSNAAEPTVLVASPTERGASPSPGYDLPAFSSLPRALVDFGDGSDEDLVLVLSTDFSDTSYHATPPRRGSADSDATSSSTLLGSEERGSPGRTASPQNKKSSRLPVRMPGMNVIKRLSASIAHAGSRHPGGHAPAGFAPHGNRFLSPDGEADVQEKVESGGGRFGRSRAVSVGATQIATPPRGQRGRSPTMPIADVAAEPARQSTMGKRLQRFGLGSLDGRK